MTPSPADPAPTAPASPTVLSDRSLACLKRSRELLDRMTPGNVAHHRGNIRLMISAVIDEAEGKQRTPSNA